MTRNKGKGNQNQQPQCNQGNQGRQPNASKGYQPNIAIQKQGKKPKHNKPHITNKSCACCLFFGHYTHQCPLLPQMHQEWEDQTIASRRPQPISTPTLPPSSSQHEVLTHPFHHQGYVASQPT